MCAKQHKDMSDAQLAKKFKSTAEPKSRFCYSGGGTVYLLDGICGVEDCSNRGTENCLEGIRNEEVIKRLE